MGDVQWRPMAASDVTAVTAAANAANEADGLPEVWAEEEIADKLDTAGLDPARDTILAVEGDEVVAWGVVDGTGSFTDRQRINLWGGVAPARRRVGLGRRLLDRQVARARELRDPTTPGAAEVWVGAVEPGAEALARGAGFEPVRWFRTLGRPLTDADVAPAAPDGFTIAAMADVDAEAVRRAHLIAWSDHWAGRLPDADQWRADVVDSSVARLDLGRVALAADGEVAGHVLVDRFEADDDVRGWREAWLAYVATVPAHRGRGVAGALIGSVLAACRAAGLDHVMLSVDADSPTDAGSLYERLGFVEEPDRREVVWALPL